MTRTKISKPGGRRRKRKREEARVARDHAEDNVQLNGSMPEESPPPKKAARINPKNNPVDAVEDFVKTENAKLRKELKRARKQMHREKAARKQRESDDKYETNTIEKTISIETGADDDPLSSTKKARTLERRSQRMLHEMQRKRADDMIRTSPHQFLWSEYVKWAKEKSISVDDQQGWTADQISVIIEDGKEPLMPFVKKVVGPNYLKETTFRKSKKTKPAVAVIAIAPSAVRAVHIAKRLYDGQPVGKLFGKHISADAQQQWLKRACRKTVVPTAVGTAKRVHRLVEEGHMTLNHTVLIAVDLSRDARLRNVLDFPLARDELCQFVHDFIRVRMKHGMKVILTIPKNQPVSLKDVKKEEQQN
ncbi:Protein Cms1 [Gracilaria domingensis]|nr:Protein Cms1 [Gracilaria domingensis]